MRWDSPSLSFLTISTQGSPLEPARSKLGSLYRSRCQGGEAKGTASRSYRRAQDGASSGYRFKMTSSRGRSAISGERGHSRSKWRFAIATSTAEPSPEPASSEQSAVSRWPDSANDSRLTADGSWLIALGWAHQSTSRSVFRAWTPNGQAHG